MDISPYLIIPIITVVVNQTVKLFEVGEDRKIAFSNLINFKKQPHWLTSMAWSLIPVTYFVDGIDSPWLATNILLLIIILEQQKRLGTTFKKQLYSAAVGVGSGIVLSAKYWQSDLDWLLSRPPENESQIYLFTFVTIVVLAEVLAYITRRNKMRKLPTSRRLQRTFRISLLTPAIFGLFFAFLQNQTKNDFLTDRIYVFSMFLWIILATVWATDMVYRNARARLAEEAEHFHQQKKHSKKKKKRKSRR